MKLKKISTIALAAVLSATSVTPVLIPATPVMAYNGGQYLNVQEANLFKGDNVQLKVNGANGMRIIWKSDNSSVVEVSSNGLIKAKNKGVANVTAEIVKATSGYGSNSENILNCDVCVNEAPRMSNSATFSQGTCALIRYQGEGIPIRFESSNKNVVNPIGLGLNEKGQDCIETDCLNPGTAKVKIYFNSVGSSKMNLSGVYNSVKTITCNVTIKSTGSLIDKIAPKTDASTRRAFKNLGYKVKLSNTFKYNGAEFVGGFNRASKTITLTRLNSRDIYYEMGIFIAAATNSANTAEFKKIYAAEKKKAQFYGDDPLEYFAQEYENMMIGEKVSGIPKTTAYIKKMIKKMSTLSTSAMQKNISKVKVERASVL